MNGLALMAKNKIFWYQNANFTQLKSHLSFRELLQIFNCCPELRTSLLLQRSKAVTFASPSFAGLHFQLPPTIGLREKSAVFFHKTPCENGIKGHNSGQQTWALDLRDMIVPRSMPEIVARRWRLKSNIQKSWNIENAVCQWLKLSTFKAKSTFKALYQPWIKTAELWKSMTALKPVLETNYYETAEKISQYIHCPRVNYSTQRVQIVGTMQWPEALQYPTHPIPFPANHGTSAVERSFNLLLKITLEPVEQWALCWTDSK